MNHPSIRSHSRGILGSSAVLLLTVLVACSDPVGPDPVQDVSQISADGTSSETLTTTSGGATVTVCKVVTSGVAGPYDFTVAQDLSNPGSREGTLLQGSSFSLSDGECVEVWQAAKDPPTADPPVTVEVEEIALASGMQFDSAKIDSPFPEVPVKSLDPQAWTYANYYHGATITFYNSEIPSPPPVCIGLTPGYWKNWANHYTADQFESLLTGTIASSIAEAEAILSAKGRSSQVEKLAMFTLANQLTLNLTGTDLPNPDGAYLTADCTHPDFDGDLGWAIDAALFALEVPGEFTEEEIEDLKDLLDAIANSGEEQEEEEEE